MPQTLDRPTATPNNEQPSPGPSPNPARPFERLENRKRVGGKLRHEIAAMTTQLSIMVRSGIDIATALRSLARQCRHKRLQEILTRVHTDLAEGKPFSQSLEEHPDVFDRMYVASVAAGEMSGRMPEVLKQLGKLLRSETQMRSRLRKMLAYPIMLVAVSGLVICGLLIFVLPQFADIFDEYDMPLPVLTEVLLGVARELQSRWWLWLIVFSAAFVGMLAWLRSQAGAMFRDRGILYWPLLRRVSRPLMIARVCRLLALMVESGVPLLESIQIVKASVTNKLYQRLLGQMEIDVLNGQGINQALESAEFLPESAAEMVITGEKTGNFAEISQLVAEHYEEQGQLRMSELVGLAEPLITVGMGLIVAVVVLAVMLPMFDIATFTN